MDQPGEFTQFESMVQVKSSARGRVAFAGVLLASCLVVGGAAVVGLNGQDETPPVLDEEPPNEEALQVDLFEDDRREDGAIVVEETVEGEVVQQLTGLAAPVAATLELASYEVSIVQEVPSFTAESISTVVGSTSSDRGRLSFVTSETRFVDGLLYELDGGVWYLKPVPQAIVGLGTLEDAIGGFADLPVREIERAEGVLTFEVLCDQIDLASADATVQQMCPQSGVVVASVDESTGRLMSIRVDGTMEISPGRFEDGFVEVTIEPAGDRVPFEVPAEVDTSRAECIADAMALPVDDMAGLMLALNENDTDRNGEIYGPCGFGLFPPGWDFLD